MSTYLMHHGIKGQKWGIRRFQNKDGSLTPQGLKRHFINDKKTKKDRIKDTAKAIFGSYPKLNTPEIGRAPSPGEIAKKNDRRGHWDWKTEKSKHRTSRDTLTSFGGDASKARYEKRRNKALTSKKPKEVLKNADTLSDKELREKLNRLQMEQNLRDLSNKNMGSGERFVKSMGNQIAKTAVTTLVVTPLMLAAKNYLENGGFYNFDVTGPTNRLRM